MVINFSLKGKQGQQPSGVQKKIGSFEPNRPFSTRSSWPNGFDLHLLNFGVPVRIQGAHEAVLPSVDFVYLIYSLCEEECVPKFVTKPFAGNQFQQGFFTTFILLHYSHPHYFLNFTPDRFRLFKSLCKSLKGSFRLSHKSSPCLIDVSSSSEA